MGFDGINREYVMTKKWWQSKVIWTNVVILLIAVVSALTEFFIGVGWSTEVLISITAIANVALRFLTETKITRIG